MAKQSMKARDVKRAKIASKYAEKRNALKASRANTCRKTRL